MADPTADELLLARAEANGYRRGAHREADRLCGREKHVLKVVKDQDRTLRRYVLYVGHPSASTSVLFPDDADSV